MKWYFGDLHCHTNLSYGRGGISRAYEIARQHLDFCSITGHAFWPDMPQDLDRHNETITMHVGGFEKCRRYWDQFLEITEKYNDSELVTFPSYEWHSNRYGDYCIYSLTGELKLFECQDLADFERVYDPSKHLIIPHHIGYSEGHRGIDWEAFMKSQLTSVVEVYSNHGCAVSDEAPYDYYHEMGPRAGRRTAEEGLAQGAKFGFIGSTDSHDGFPANFSHGRLGVLAEEKTRKGIWDGLMNRRTMALTGAKIISEFEVNGAGVGSICSVPEDRDIRFRLQGNQPIRNMTLVKNGKPISIIPGNGSYRSDSDDASDIFYVKLEWGWGSKIETVDWDSQLKIDEGELLEVEPCFRHTAFDDLKVAPHHIDEQTDRMVRWKSKTRGVPDAFMHNPQTMTSGVNAFVLKIKATSRTKLSFTSNLLDLDVDWKQLLGGSVVQHSGGPCSPAVRIHRPYSETSCSLEGHLVDSPECDEDSYYLWGTQLDNESIWVSPVWAQR